MKYFQPCKSNLSLPMTQKNNRAHFLSVDLHPHDRKVNPQRLRSGLFSIPKSWADSVLDLVVNLLALISIVSIFLLGHYYGKTLFKFMGGFFS